MPLRVGASIPLLSAVEILEPVDADRPLADIRIGNDRTFACDSFLGADIIKVRF